MSRETLAATEVPLTAASLRDWIERSAKTQTGQQDAHVKLSETDNWIRSWLI
jgi:hypothetical protein